MGNRKEWIFPSVWCWRHLALSLFTTWGVSGYWYSLVLLGFGIAHSCHNTRVVFWATEGQGLLFLFPAARVTSLLMSEKYLGKPLLLNEVFPQPAASGLCGSLLFVRGHWGLLEKHESVFQAMQRAKCWGLFWSSFSAELFKSGLPML